MTKQKFFSPDLVFIFAMVEKEVSVYIYLVNVQFIVFETKSGPNSPSPANQIVLKKNMYV